MNWRCAPVFLFALSSCVHEYLNMPRRLAAPSGVPAVHSERDPEMEHQQFQTFSVMVLEPTTNGSVKASNSISARGLHFMTRSIMEECGLVYDEEHPDFVVMVHLIAEAESRYVPPQPYSLPIYVPPETYQVQTHSTGSSTTYLGSAGVASTYSSGSATGTITTPASVRYETGWTQGRTVERFIVALRLDLYSPTLDRGMVRFAVAQEFGTTDRRILGQYLLRRYLPGLLPRYLIDLPVQISNETTDGNVFWPTVVDATDNSGFAPGDIFYSIDGVRMSNQVASIVLDSLRHALKSNAKIFIYRDGRKHEWKDGKVVASD